MRQHALVQRVCLCAALGCGIIFWSAALGAETDESICYSKSFPGSKPAYVFIEVSRSGSAVYKEAPDDDQPVSFQLPPEVTAEIFERAARLDYFARPLEAPLKVANMGRKTFRYRSGTKQQETSFNYSLNEDARALVDLFERLTETQQHLFELERAVRFDKLGVNQALLRLEASMDRKRVIGAERFLPMLDRVVKNDAYLHMARERAAALAAAIRNPKSKAE